MMMMFAFSALTLLVGLQEEHPVCKIFEWWGASMVVCLEWGANGWCHLYSIISCFIKIQNASAFLLLTYPDFPGKEGVKQL